MLLNLLYLSPQLASPSAWKSLDAAAILGMELHVVESCIFETQFQGQIALKHAYGHSYIVDGVLIRAGMHIL